MIRDDSHTVSGSSAASEMPKSGLRVGRGEGRNGGGADPMSLTEATSTPITGHVTLDPDKVLVKMDRGKTVSTLEVDIELPNEFEKSLAAAS